MDFKDKNGREIKIGDHIAWMRRRYKKPPVRRVAEVTKITSKKKRGGTDVYRVTAHLDFTYPYSYMANRYIALPAGVNECGEPYVYHVGKNYRGEEQKYSQPCNKFAGHTDEHGRRELEPYLYTTSHHEYGFPSFGSKDGNFPTIEVVDEPVTSSENYGEREYGLE